MIKVTRCLFVLCCLLILGGSTRGEDLVNLGAYGTANGYGFVPFVTCVQEGKPGVLFGVKLTPKGAEISYVVIIKCKNGRDTKVKLIEGGNKITQGQITTWQVTNGIKIDDQSLLVKYDGSADTTTGKFDEKIDFNNKSLDLTKGRIILVDLTLGQLKWQQVTGEFPTDLPNLTAKDGEKLEIIARASAQILRHLVSKSDEVAPYAGAAVVAAVKLRRGYIEFLKEEGYSPKMNEYGHIDFKREDKLYRIVIDDNDPLYFYLLFPGYFKVTEELRALRAVNYTNALAKVARTYIINNNVSSSVELFMSKPDQYQATFSLSMKALEHAASTFKKEVQDKD